MIIANEGSGKVLDVRGGDTANGTNIHQYSFNQTSAQKWIAVKQSDGSFELISALDQILCIDLSVAQTEIGSNVQLYESNGTKAQRWVIEKELTIDNFAQDHRNVIDDGRFVI